MNALDGLRHSTLHRQHSVPALPLHKKPALTDQKIRRLSTGYVNSPLKTKDPAQVGVYDFPQKLCRKLLTSVGDYIVCGDPSSPEFRRVDYINSQGQFCSQVMATHDLEFFLKTDNPLELKQRYQGSAFDPEFAIADESLEDCATLRQADPGKQKRCFQLILATQRSSIAQLIAKGDHQLFQNLVEEALQRQDTVEIDWLLETCFDILKQAACPAFYAAYKAVSRQATLEQYTSFTRLFNQQQFTPRDPHKNMQRILQNPDARLYLRSNPKGLPIDPALHAFALAHGSQGVLEAMIRQGLLKEADYFEQHENYPTDLRCFMAFYNASTKKDKATKFLSLAPIPDAVDEMFDKGARVHGTDALYTAIYYQHREAAAQILEKAGHSAQQLISCISTCYEEGVHEELALYAGLFLRLGRRDIASELVRACRPNYYPALRECLRNAHYAVWGGGLSEIVKECTEKLQLSPEKARELLDFCSLAGYLPQQIRDLIDANLEDLLSTRSLQSCFATAMRSDIQQLLPTFVDWANRLGCQQALLLNCICANDSYTLEELFEADLTLPEDVSFCVEQAQKRYNLTACALLMKAEADSDPEKLLGIKLAGCSTEELCKILTRVYLNSKPEDVWWLLDSLKEQPALAGEIAKLERFLHHLAPLIIPYQRDGHRKEAIEQSNTATKSYLAWQIECGTDRQQRVQALRQNLIELKDFLPVLHALRQTEREFRPLRNTSQVLRLHGRLSAADGIVRRQRRRYALDTSASERVYVLPNGDYQVWYKNSSGTDVPLTCVEADSDGVLMIKSDPEQLPGLIAELHELFARFMQSKDKTLIPQIYWLFVHANLEDDPDGQVALMLHELMRRHCDAAPVAISPHYALPSVVALACSLESFREEFYEHVFEELPSL